MSAMAWTFQSGNPILGEYSLLPYCPLLYHPFPVNIFLFYNNFWLVAWCDIKVFKHKFLITFLCRKCLYVSVYLYYAVALIFGNLPFCWDIWLARVNSPGYNSNKYSHKTTIWHSWEESSWGQRWFGLSLLCIPLVPPGERIKQL